MALTNAEKQRRYREKLKNNPEKQEEVRKKNLQRIKTKTKKVGDMTEAEKLKQREIWRSQKRRQKQNQTQKASKDRNKTEKPEKNTTSYKIHYKKLAEKYKKALLMIKRLHTVTNTLRQRLYREKQRANLEVQKEKEEAMLVRASCEMHESVLRSIYKKSCSLEKRKIKTVVLNEAFRRGKTVSSVARSLGVKKIKINRSRKKGVSEKIRIEMETFYSRDDISRMTSGKKESRTYKKDKKQIRYLTDTLNNLYKIYKAEGGKYGFTTFFKYKPFYVLSPTMQSRETCLCVKHSNMDYLLKGLKTACLKDKNLTDILKMITCDIQSYECMHNKCQKCMNSVPELNLNDKEKIKEVKWYQWEREDHTYKKTENEQSKDVTTKRTIKKMKTGTIAELINSFNEKIIPFKKHYYNMKMQQQQYRKCIEQLGPHEVLLLCDFSENFSCKLSEEIQALHFGASKQQVTLHCGIIYWAKKCESFCSVSDSPCHEPPAIWAHLMPVLKHLKQQDPNITVIHYFSDGPSSQYRQKKNFYFFNLFSNMMKMHHCTWSFSESGHGKGVADGIGGAVKRALDRQVLYGHDISNAQHAYDNIVAAVKSVKSYLIPTSEIDNMKTITPNNLRAIPGTMEIHQIMMTKERNCIQYRSLSCFCGEMCLCYLPKTHYFVANDKTSASTIKIIDDGSKSYPEKTKLAEIVNPEIIPIITPDNLLEMEEVPRITEDSAVISSVNNIDLEMTTNAYAYNDQPADHTNLEIPIDLDKIDQDDLIVLPQDSTLNITDNIISDDQDICCDLETKSNYLEDTNIVEDMKKVTPKSLNEMSYPLPEEHFCKTEYIASSTTRPMERPTEYAYIHQKRVKVLNPVNDVMRRKEVILKSDKKENDVGDIKILKEIKMVARNELSSPSAFNPDYNEPSTTIGIKRSTQFAYITPKRVKVLKPVNMVKSEKEEYRSKSLKTVITRTFLCYICKMRKSFDVKKMISCMACRNWACVECSGTTAFDYICETCILYGPNRPN